jgi:hypothetical protein
VHETPGISHVAILHFVLGISSRQKHVNDGSDCMICLVEVGGKCTPNFGFEPCGLSLETGEL